MPPTPPTPVSVAPQRRRQRQSPHHRAGTWHQQTARRAADRDLPSAATPAERRCHGEQLHHAAETLVDAAVMARTRRGWILTAGGARLIARGWTINPDAARLLTDLDRAEQP